MTHDKSTPIDGDPSEFFYVLSAQWKDDRWEEFGRLRCRTCKQVRAMDLYWHGKTTRIGPGGSALISPGLGVFICRDCGAGHPAGISFKRNDSPAETAIDLFGPQVSIATPQTPKAVAFYLDQAARSKSAGAKSGAAAMFRAAVEHVLYEQGYQDRMLGPKIAALEKAKADGKAPEWARDVEADELTALKKLGDGAIHPNGGDVSIQEVFEDGTLEDVEAVIEHLLKKVYEEPAERAALRQRLKAKADVVAPPKKAP